MHGFASNPGARSVATLVVCATALFAAGCCARDRSSATKSDSRPDIGVDPKSGTAAAWSVRTGASGGFTGGGSGHVIDASGLVRAWSQITPSDSTTWTHVGQASPAAIAALEAALRAPALQTSELLETGNLTVFLEWRDPPRVTRWTWAERGRATKLPPGVQRAYETTQAAVASARAAADAAEGKQ